jgi:hypothetical protein
VTWVSLILVTALVTVLVTLGAADARAEKGYRDLYLASRDEIRPVLKIRSELPENRGGYFIGIVGGLASFNFIERLQPNDILLVDLNPAQVEYGRCVVELIRAVPSRHDFIATFFSRPFLEDEEAFLAQPGDLSKLAELVATFEDAGLRESCTADLTLIAEATYDAKTKSLLVARNTNGKNLLRGGPDRGMPRGYNFMYYGKGWLESDISYERTRAALRTAKVRFLASDIGAVPVKDIRGKFVFFWGTNLATWFAPGKEAYERFVIRVHEELASRNQSIRFGFASTYRRTGWTEFVPFKKLGDGVHLDASAKTKKHTQGKTVLELIPGRAYFGKELRAKESVVKRAGEPIEAEASFDVAVLHILNNSGFKWWKESRDSEFLAIYREVLERAKEVVVLEHNPRSADFTDKDRARMVGLDGLLKPLFEVLKSRSLSLAIEFAVGQTDDTRNLVLHIRKR